MTSLASVTDLNETARRRMIEWFELRGQEPPGSLTGNKKSFADLWVKAVDFAEDDHPRDERGRFTAGERAAVAERLDEAGFGKEPGLERLGDPKFETEADVNEWAKSRGITVDKKLVNQIGLDNLAVMAGTHDDLVSKYPTLDGKMATWQYAGRSTASLAYTKVANGGTTDLYISKSTAQRLADKNGEEEWKKEGGTDWSTKRGYIGRFGVGTSFRDLIVHEYGHAAHNVAGYQFSEGGLKMAMVKADWIPGSRYPDREANIRGYDDWTNELRRVSGELASRRDAGETLSDYEQHQLETYQRQAAERTDERRDRAVLGDEMSYTVFDRIDPQAVSDVVSRYGATNPRETFAEVFSMMNSDKPIEDMVSPSAMGMSKEERQAKVDKVTAFQSEVNRLTGILGAGRIL